MPSHMLDICTREDLKTDDELFGLSVNTKMQNQEWYYQNDVTWETPVI